MHNSTRSFEAKYGTLREMPEAVRDLLQLEHPMLLLDEIIDGAVDDKRSLPSLLRKCLLLAHKLKNEKLKAWAEYELNGYPDGLSLPGYRQVPIRTLGTFIGPAGSSLKNAQLAVTIMDEDHRHWAELSLLMQPIAAYETGKDAEGKPNSGRMPWPPELVAIYATKFYSRMRLVSAYQEIPGTVLVAVMDTVRTKILQLALELKDEVGEAESKGDAVPSRKVDQSVVNHIYGGNVVIASTATNFSQIGSITIDKGNLDQFRQALKQLGLDDKAIASLEKEMGADAAATGGTPTLGQRTKKWLGKAASYASKAGLKVGIDLAKKTVTKWVLQYYGLDIG